MPAHLYTFLALSCALLTAGPAAAKTVHHTHHVVRHMVHRHVDVRYAQGFYDYRSASRVREEFHDGPTMRWQGGGHWDHRDFHRESRGGMVVENLRSGDFTGGVGYGVNGDVPSFVDGYGERHFFVGSFRRMAPRPAFHRGF